MIAAPRALLAALVVSVLASPAVALAQPAAKLPRIGVLHPGTGVGGGHLFDAFKEGMREHGYVEGRNVVYERRLAGLDPERSSALAGELIRLKVDVIVTGTDIDHCSQTADADDPDRDGNQDRPGRERLHREPGPSRRKRHGAQHDVPGTQREARAGWR